MRTFKILSVALATLAFLGTRSFAGSDVNEVGALLVYPIVATLHGPDCTSEDDCGSFCNSVCEGNPECVGFCLYLCEIGIGFSAEAGPAESATSGPTSAFELDGTGPASGPEHTLCEGEECPDVALTETFITVTNAGPTPVVAHFTYIDGDEQDLVGTYCEECDFSVPLTGNDTETLVLTSSGSGTLIRSEDTLLEISCPFSFGMLVVSLENAAGETLADNVLLGDAVLVNYVDGSAFSLPAIPFQGLVNDGDRIYRFDDAEYGRLPRIVAADFLTPPPSSTTSFAALSLFTLDFERHHAPLTDCSVTGFDADEQPFSASFQFGCWTLRDLCDISPEFCYPNLGLVGDGDTHGWLQLNCRVDRDPPLHDGFETNGGVHGAILQQRDTGAALPSGSTKVVAGQIAWATLLHQSVTAGDSTTLTIEAPAPGLF